MDKWINGWKMEDLERSTRNIYFFNFLKYYLSVVYLLFFCLFVNEGMIIRNVNELIVLLVEEEDDFEMRLGHWEFSDGRFGSMSSQLLASPSRPRRKMPKKPFKVLDAPTLQDDFHLNLLDWLPLNVLASALDPSVFLWSASTSQVTRLVLWKRETVTSVVWSQAGEDIAIGTNKGQEIWRIPNVVTLQGPVQRAIFHFQNV
jgi:hypothetical protein